jgi:hypothetical protein
MAPNKHRLRPFLEPLESRETPSITTSFNNGFLSIREVRTNAAARTVALTAITDHKVSVTVNGKSIGTFGNVSNVLVSLNNGAADQVHVTIKAGLRLGANLTVIEGSGNGDTFTIDGTGAGGSLTGRLLVLQGAGGADSIRIGSAGAVALLATTTLVGNSGPGTAVSVSHSSELGAGASIVNANAFTLDTGASVPGSLTIADTSLGEDATVSINGTTIGGNLNFSGGAGTSTIAFTGALLGGNLQFTGGANANSLTIDGGSTVGGSVLFSGPGADSINLAGTIGTNLTLNFGNSNANSYTFTAASSIGGNLSILAGNGGNAIALGGSIGGDVFINLGNGSNSFTIDATADISGGQVTYKGGTGADAVTVNSPTNGFALFVDLGGATTGTDSIDLTNVTALGNATLKWGTFGSKAYTPPTATLSFAVTLINFP